MCWEEIQFPKLCSLALDLHVDIVKDKAQQVRLLRQFDIVTKFYSQYKHFTRLGGMYGPTCQLVEPCHASNMNRRELPAWSMMQRSS